MRNREIEKWNAQASKEQRRIRDEIQDEASKWVLAPEIINAQMIKDGKIAKDWAVIKQPSPHPLGNFQMENSMSKAKRISEYSDIELLHLFGETAGRLSLHNTQALHIAYFEQRDELEKRFKEHRSETLKEVKEMLISRAFSWDLEKAVNLKHDPEAVAIAKKNITSKHKFV